MSRGNRPKASVRVRKVHWPAGVAVAEEAEETKEAEGSIGARLDIIPGMEHYHVRIVRADLVFSAGHFITFGSDLCERLHGHNYRSAPRSTGRWARIIMWSISRF